MKHPLCGRLIVHFRHVLYMYYMNKKRKGTTVHKTTIIPYDTRKIGQIMFLTFKRGSCSIKLSNFFARGGKCCRDRKEERAERRVASRRKNRYDEARFLYLLGTRRRFLAASSLSLSLPLFLSLSLSYMCIYIYIYTL